MIDGWTQTGQFRYQGRVVGKIYARGSYSIVSRRNAPRNYEYAVWHGKTTATTMPSLVGVFHTPAEARSAADEHANRAD